MRVLLAPSFAALCAACGGDSDGDGSAVTCASIAACEAACEDDTCAKACDDHAPAEVAEARRALWLCEMSNSCENDDACIRELCANELAACE